MDTNHRVSRLTNGWLSPKFKVVFSASAKSPGPELETVFDAADGTLDRFSLKTKSLPDTTDRVEFVQQIAKQFNHLMKTARPYMDGELRKIAGWLNA